MPRLEQPGDWNNGLREVGIAATDGICLRRGRDLVSSGNCGAVSLLLREATTQGKGGH
ncbi:hypothetical protein D3C72_2523480 [compost metagenome]